MNVLVDLRPLVDVHEVMSVHEVLDGTKEGSSRGDERARHAELEQDTGFYVNTTL